MVDRESIRQRCYRTFLIGARSSLRAERFTRQRRQSPCDPRKKVVVDIHLQHNRIHLDRPLCIAEQLRHLADPHDELVDESSVALERHASRAQSRIKSAYWREADTPRHSSDNFEELHEVVHQPVSEA